MYTCSKGILDLFVILWTEGYVLQLSILSRFCVCTFLYFIPDKQTNSSIQSVPTSDVRETPVVMKTLLYKAPVHLFVCLSVCMSILETTKRISMIFGTGGVH